MESLSLEKIMKLSVKIEELKEINLVDKIDYYRSNDGVQAKGEILIEGKFLAGGEVGKFTEKVDIDIFTPIENIQRREELRFEIADFDYSIKDESVLFKINVHIKGWKEYIKNFIPSEEELQVEPIMIEEEIDTEEIMRKLQALTESQPESTSELFLSKDLSGQEKMEEMAIDQLIVDNIVDSEQPISPTIIQESVLEKSDLLEADLEVKTDEHKLIKMPEMKVKKIEKKEEIVKHVEEKVEGERPRSIFESLFSNVKDRNICWKFHSVGLGETYKDIADKYQILEEELIKINNNCQLAVGKLICLP